MISYLAFGNSAFVRVESVAKFNWLRLSKKSRKALLFMLSGVEV